jgi:hypothetical protein
MRKNARQRTVAWVGAIGVAACATGLLAFYLAATAPVAATIPGRVPAPVATLSAVGSIPGLVCALPVRTDRGPGILAFPTGAFVPSGLTSTAGRAYDARSRRWLATEPQYLNPQGSEAAFLDTSRSGQMTLTLRNSNGEEVFSQDGVRSIVGWSLGFLYITTASPDRLLKISANGTTAIVVHAELPGDIWYAASSSALWGIAPTQAQDGSLEIVRLDANTGAVSDWYALPADSAGVTRASIIGIDAAGRPIWADLSVTTHAGVYVATSPGQIETIYRAYDYADRSLRRPMEAILDSTGAWVTTADGELIRQANGALMRITPAGGLHIYDFGGTCG